MSPEAEGTPTTVRIEIGALEGVWLPDVGAVREIDFAGDRAAGLRQGAHYNDATGTAVVTAGRAAGDAYTLETVIPEVPSDAALADVPFAPLKMPKQEGVPESLTDLGSAAIEDAETPIERARALESWLQTDGFFSHGLADDVYSPSGHGAARMISLFGGDQLIGDDEQYAVAMALIARQLGMPARVVMGWYPDEDEQSSGVFTATGDNLHAWVEIAFTDQNLLDAPPPDVDVILAGDICYERPMAEAVMAWLAQGRATGARVLIGDPGRTYFRKDGLEKLAEYQVPTTRELEDLAVKRTSVWTLP